MFFMNNNPTTESDGNCLERHHKFNLCTMSYMKYEEKRGEKFHKSQIRATYEISSWGLIDRSPRTRPVDSSYFDCLHACPSVWLAGWRLRHALTGTELFMSRSSRFIRYWLHGSTPSHRIKSKKKGEKYTARSKKETVRAASRIFKPVKAL